MSQINGLTDLLKIINVNRTILYVTCEQNKTKWLALLLHIMKVTGQNAGPHTGYPDDGVSWFYSAPPGKFRVTT